MVQGNDPGEVIGEKRFRRSNPKESEKESEKAKQKRTRDELFESSRLSYHHTPAR